MPKYVVNAVVTWQKMVGLAFDIAENKGAQFDGIEDGGEFMEDLGEYWSQNKAEIKQLTEEQTRNRLRKLIEA